MIGAPPSGDGPFKEGAVDVAVIALFAQ